MSCWFDVAAQQPSAKGTTMLALESIKNQRLPRNFPIPCLTRGMRLAYAQRPRFTLILAQAPWICSVPITSMIYISPDTSSSKIPTLSFPYQLTNYCDTQDILDKI